MADPSAVEVLGASWCEDTALVRDRLHFLGVPVEEHDVERDPAAGARIRALNGGHQVTPTVVLGEAGATAEPTLERLTELLRDAGHEVSLPQAVPYHAPLTESPVPLGPAPLTPTGPLSLGAFRGRRQVALFLAHDAACLACHGYARQLAAVGDDLRAADASSVIVVPGGLDALEAWRPGLDPSAVAAADAGGRWKQAVAAHVGFDASDAAVLLLDRWLAPRTGSVAAEAGGLIDPSEAVRWLEFVLLECPECAGEIGWASELG